METPQKAAAAFPAYYLEVFAESEVEDEMSDHVSCLLSDYQQREGKQFAALLDECRYLFGDEEFLLTVFRGLKGTYECMEHP